MTIQDLIDLSVKHQNLILYFFFSIPLLVYLFAYFKKSYGTNNLLKIVYTFFIYLVSIPAVLSIILLLYSVIVLKVNILELNLIIYIFPSISMGLTFFIIEKVIGLKNIPSFEKISSFLVLIFVTFLIVFLLQKLFIGIIFMGSFYYLVFAFIIIFFIIKTAIDKIKK